ncbi:uncharacterized protein LOC124152874 isoform X1 [Haliotis rufescens]|uniref:uncharacterized protein LOC124152874 isoform X1 n=2 Tax=Haliotis rufescens TaxID=6454 RepID=UPI001EB00CBD|nr:uncharacterized protein LOC124152874 isoform X1 [Haliotis rufescens]
MSSVILHHCLTTNIYKSAMMLVYLTFTLALLSSAVAINGPCAPNENLLTFLKAIHNIPSYSTMSPDNKVLLTEMVSEVQICQLTAYVNTIGFSKVLGLLDSLTPQEAHLLNSYLVKHLNIEKAVSDKLHHTTTRPPTPHH